MAERTGSKEKRAVAGTGKVLNELGRTAHNPLPVRFTATERGLVVEDVPENKLYLKYLRDQVGKVKLNKDREASVEDSLESKRIIGGRVPKEFITDHDALEICVASIDEKMLDLLEGDMDSAANTKAYNELRDQKNIILDLKLGNGLSYAGAAKRLAEKFDAEGRADEAILARDAGDLLVRARDGYMDQVDYAAEDYAGEIRGAVRSVIEGHNERVQSNAVRSAELSSPVA